MARDSNGNETATAFVLKDAEGREFDTHAITLDEQGNGIPAWKEDENFIFTKEDFAGEGKVSGYVVKCITPESQVYCHSGYEIREKQISDLDFLNEKFGVGYPDGYSKSK